MATTTNKMPKAGGFRRAPAWTVATAALTMSVHCGAAEWKIIPSLDVGETYTDNVRLAPSGAEKSDFVTQVSPGILLIGSGPGLKFKANYVMQNLVYARDKDQNTTIHQLNADLNAELVKDFFFFDGRAGINRQNISPFGPQAIDNTNITNNRADVRTYTISPYLRHQFGHIASADLRYSHDSINASTGGLLASHTDRVGFNLNSGSAFRILGWGLHYNHQKIAYSDLNTPTVDTTTSSGNLRYMLTQTFSLTATGGYEKSTYVSIKEKPEGYFWTAGFSWKPSDRTSVEASAGKRFYGRTFSLAANHRARHTLWTVGYNEDVTTAQSQFLVPVTIDTSGFLNQLWLTSIPDPAVRQQTVDAFIRSTSLPASLSQNVNIFTNRFFLQKNLQASVALTGVRNTLVFSLFNTLRYAQTAQGSDGSLFGTSGGILDDNTRQVGASAIWNLKISPRTNANLSTSYSKVTSLSTNRVDNNKTIRLALTKQFAPKLNGGIEVRRLQQNSNQSGGDIRENAIAASISMKF
jgi:uncharacterized protein (PEP-CTERM system associated)